MNPSAYADLARLNERVDALEERLDSTRQRFDEHAQASAAVDGEMAKSLQAIQMDVHDIRAGKRAMLWLARVILAAVVTTGGGLILGGRWVLTHYVQDLEKRGSP